MRLETKVPIEEGGVARELSSVCEISWREDVVIAIRKPCDGDVVELIGFGASRIRSRGATANSGTDDNRLTSALTVHA